jgi:hypothetical protein
VRPARPSSCCRVAWEAAVESAEADGPVRCQTRGALPESLSRSAYAALVTAALAPFPPDPRDAGRSRDVSRCVCREHSGAAATHTGGACLCSIRTFSIVIHDAPASLGGAQAGATVAVVVGLVAARGGLARSEQIRSGRLSAEGGTSARTAGGSSVAVGLAGSRAGRGWSPRAIGAASGRLWCGAPGYRIPSASPLTSCERSCRLRCWAF